MNIKTTLISININVSIRIIHVYMSKRVSTVTEKPGQRLNFGPLKSADHSNQKLRIGELF